MVGGVYGVGSGGLFFGEFGEVSWYEVGVFYLFVDVVFVVFVYVFDGFEGVVECFVLGFEVVFLEVDEVLWYVEVVFGFGFGFFGGGFFGSYGDVF